ncbi:UNVERIFIED_CONTAM: hypothetical protein HDU68_010645 [Siphonaria sp. JEL0065]|nr:hypothetical protein HDU68_010645 [Siphonaria sp. JEL0065]
MRKTIQMAKESNIESHDFTTIKLREEIRLLIASVGMTIVTILSIINAVHTEFDVLSIWRIVFVYVQLIMVLSQKGVAASGERTSESKSSKPSKA